MPRKVRIPQDPAQARANQQRSRARRREHVEDLERRLRDFEAHGARASLEMQAASRHVAWKNDRLMDMLVNKAGVERRAVERHLAAEWAALTTTATTSPAAAALSGAGAAPVAVRNGWSPAGPLLEEQQEQHGLHLLSAAAAAGGEDLGGTYKRHCDGGCSSVADTSTGTLVGWEDKHQSQEDGHQRFPARDSNADESLSPPPPALGGHDRATMTNCPAKTRITTTTICGPALLQVLEGSTQTVEMTSCDDAVDMIANLRGHGDATDARELLGCPSSGNCNVKNARLFQLMVETT